MAYTLAQLAKIETTPLKKGVILNLLRYAPIMDSLPFENVDSLHSIAVRWKTLPGAAFRKVNASYTTSEGDVDQVEEAVYGMGGGIKFDRVFDKIKNVIQDPKVMQMDMKTRAMALTFNWYFINGDHAVDPDGFEGLKKRVANMPTRQTVYAAASNAAGLDPTASTANARAFLDKLEEAYYKCNNGNVQMIIGNEAFRWSLGRAIRFLQASGASFLSTQKDQFEREIMTYKGTPIYDAGLKVDQSTEVITLTEAGGTGTANTTSFYLVSTSTPTGDVQGAISEGLTGIQLGPMEIYDVASTGEQTEKHIDWWVGLANFGAHSIVRVRNLLSPASWT